MKLTAIVPVHNGGSDLPRCLEALAASTRPPDEIVVVDDASTDGSGELARLCGARVVAVDGGPLGPAAARNLGAGLARGDVLAFVDADVAVHPDALARIEQVLAGRPDVAALFGSYDAAPAARGWVSRYKNLLHHYVHQHGQREAFTFWAGCGAIRRRAFEEVGGFDPGYARPSIEDIELGARLRRAGHRVWLCPDVQATHLKRWTLAGLLRSDIGDRAIPWTRLLLSERRLPADLNLSLGGRVSALSLWLALACLILALWRPWAWAGVLLGGASWALLNADLYRFFGRQGGAAFGAAAAGLHALYLLYSSLVFGSLALPAWLARRGLAVLLAAVLLKGVVWSLVVPPWHAPDEPQHFLYAQSIERWRTLRIEPSLWVPEEARRLFELSQFGAVRYGKQPLDLSDRAGIAAQIAALDDPAVKRTLVEDRDRQLIRVRNFTSFHPPLAYALTAVVQWPLEGTSIRVRLLASRWLSVVLGAVTAALAYGAGRELWPARPGRALLLATLAGFQPMATFCAAVVSNMALEIALFTACLFLGLRVIHRGLTWRRGVVLGTVTGLGLLTKTSFLCALALLGLLAAWRLVSARGKRWTWARLWTWAPVWVLPALLAGWWYARPLWGGEALLSAYGPLDRRPAVRLLPYLVRYPWLTTYRDMVDQFWGNFGWLDAPMGATALALLGGSTVVAIWSAGWWLVRRCAAHPRAIRSRSVGSMLFVGSATLCTIAFYTALDYRVARDLGGRFGLQGRYFLPPLIGQMAWLLWGLSHPAPPRLRPLCMWAIGGGMIAANLYALFGTILPRYYGAGSLLQRLARAAVLQPVGEAALIAVCAAFLLVTPALCVALAGAMLSPSGTAGPLPPDGA